MQFYIVIAWIYHALCQGYTYPANDYEFQETRDKHIYTVKIPSQPAYITERNIAIFIFQDYFVLWVRGSGDRRNLKNINMTTPDYSQVTDYNFGQDFHSWINFIKPVKNTTVPVIQKLKKPDGSFKVTLAFDRGGLIERTASLHLFNFTKIGQKDNWLKYQTKKVDLLSKIPDNPHYVRRVFKLNDGRVRELFTVEDDKGKAIE